MRLFNGACFIVLAGYLAHPGVCSATEEVKEKSEPIPAQGRPKVEGVTKLVKMGILYNAYTTTQSLVHNNIIMVISSWDQP